MSFPYQFCYPALRGGTFSKRYAELDIDDEMADPIIADPTVEVAGSPPDDITVTRRQSKVDSAVGGCLATRGTVRHSDRV